MHRRAFFGFLAGGAVAAAAPLAFPDVEQTYKHEFAKGTTLYWRHDRAPRGYALASWDGKKWRLIDQSAAFSP